MYKMNYKYNLSEFDFFKFAKAIKMLNSGDLCDSIKDKTISKLFEILMLIPIMVTKSKEYENEQEWRMISFLGANMGYTYDFSDLHSVTFAPETEEEDKEKIIEIIVKKCKKNNRTNFKIYQSYLDFSSASMERFLLFEDIKAMEDYLKR